MTISMQVAGKWEVIREVRRAEIRQLLQELKAESRREGVVSRIMAPQRGLCPNPTTDEYLRLHGKVELKLQMQLR